MERTHCTDYPCPHSDWQAYVQLPAKIRVDPDTKYIVFVCDSAPGVKVPQVQEYWPPNGNFAGLKSLPPMAKMDCSNTKQDDMNPYGSLKSGTFSFHCPWVTENDLHPGPNIENHGMCDACTDCRPEAPGTYPPYWNMTINNTQMDVTWRIDILRGDSQFPPVGPSSTCAWGKGHRGQGGEEDPYDKGDLWPERGPSPNEYLVRPYSVANIAIPGDVSAIHGIPMYSAGIGVCVVEARSGFPKTLHLDRREYDGCIDSVGTYPHSG